MFVYVITNRITGKVYIGQHKSAKLKQYLQKKFHHSRKQRTGSSYLFNAMRKYPDATDWSIAPILELPTREELNRWERILIALYDTRNPDIGYNICRGGEGRTAPLSPEEKTKLRENNIRYWDNLNNLIGQKFGRLTVESQAERRKSGVERKGRKLWNCRCKCGNVSTVTTHSLKSGNIRSCGCLIADAGRKRWAKLDLVGQTFGKLTVQSEAAHYRSQRQWNCLCICGNKPVVRTNSLRSGNTKSCGCSLWNSPVTTVTLTSDILD